MDCTTCRQGLRSSMGRSSLLSRTRLHQDVNPMLIQRRTKQYEPGENGEGLQKVRLGSHTTDFVYRICLALLAFCVATLTCIEIVAMPSSRIRRPC
jgi:hypothetical protein